MLKLLRGRSTLRWRVQDSIFGVLPYVTASNAMAQQEVRHRATGGVTVANDCQLTSSKRTASAVLFSISRLPFLFFFGTQSIEEDLKAAAATAALLPKPPGAPRLAWALSHVRSRALRFQARHLHPRTLHVFLSTFPSSPALPSSHLLISSHIACLVVVPETGPQGGRPDRLFQVPRARG